MTWLTLAATAAAVAGAACVLAFRRRDVSRPWERILTVGSVIAVALGAHLVMADIWIAYPVFLAGAAGLGVVESLGEHRRRRARRARVSLSRVFR